MRPNTAAWVGLERLGVGIVRRPLCIAEALAIPIPQYEPPPVPPMIEPITQTSSRSAYDVVLASAKMGPLAGEFVIADWKAAGLNVPSAVKRGIYTIEDSLVQKVVAISEGYNPVGAILTQLVTAHVTCFNYTGCRQTIASSPTALPGAFYKSVLFTMPSRSIACSSARPQLKLGRWASKFNHNARLPHAIKVGLVL